MKPTGQNNLYDLARVCKIVPEINCLRPASLLPKNAQRYGSQLFQHGKDAEIKLFKANKGWFFKRDRGTNIVYEIPERIRNKLEQWFIQKPLSAEEQRKFGAMMMSLGQLGSKNALGSDLCESLTIKLNTCKNVQDIMRGIEALLDEASKQKFKDSYQYWEGFIRSLDEGAAKVEEQKRCLILNQTTEKFRSSKHDLAKKLGILDRKEYSKDTLFTAIERCEDKGHVMRKIEKLKAKDSEDKAVKRYLLMGAIHNFLIDNEKNRVPDTPEKKQEIIDSIANLKQKSHESFHSTLDTLLQEIKNATDQQVSHFVQFGTLANKSKEKQKQKLKEYVKTMPVLPLNEAIVLQPDQTKDFQNVFQLTDILKLDFNSDTHDMRSFYLYGLKSEEPEALKNFLSSIMKLKNGSEKIGKDTFLELFKGRPEEALALLPQFESRIDRSTTSDILNELIKTKGIDTKKDRLKAIFVSEALKSNSCGSFSLEALRMSFGNAELNRILTSIPIRVGAGAAHFPFESASIPTLVAFLEAENSSGIRKYASGALANLSDNPVNIVKIGETEKAIKNLVACLDCSDIQIKKEAARALANLAMSPDNRVKICKAVNSITKLVDCLGSADIELKKEAARVLVYFACNLVYVYRIKETENAITHLVACLDCSDIELKKIAARALSHLTCDPVNIEKRGETENAINHLVACLDSSDIELKKIAARALVNLATNNRENKETIIDAYVSSKKDNKDFDFVRGLNNLIKKELKGWVSNYRTAINENLQLGQLGIKVCRTWFRKSVITQNQGVTFILEGDH